MSIALRRGRGNASGSWIEGEAEEGEADGAGDAESEDLKGFKCDDIDPNENGLRIMPNVTSMMKIPDKKRLSEN